MDYNSKYSKYKAKYLELKGKIGQKGGALNQSSNFANFDVYSSIAQNLRAKLENDSMFLSSLKRGLGQRGGYAQLEASDLKLFKSDPDKLKQEKISDIETFIQRHLIESGTDKLVLWKPPSGVEFELGDTNSQLVEFKTCFESNLLPSIKSKSDREKFARAMTTNPFNIQSSIGDPDFNALVRVGGLPLNDAKNAALEYLNLINSCIIYKKNWLNWVTFRNNVIDLMFLGVKDLDQQVYKNQLEINKRDALTAEMNESKNDAVSLPKRSLSLVPLPSSSSSRTSLSRSSTVSSLKPLPSSSSSSQLQQFPKSLSKNELIPLKQVNEDRSLFEPTPIMPERLKRENTMVELKGESEFIHPASEEIDGPHLLAKIEAIEKTNIALKSELDKLNALIAAHTHAPLLSTNDTTKAQIDQLRRDISDVFTQVLQLSAEQETRLGQIRIARQPFFML